MISAMVKIIDRAKVIIEVQNAVLIEHDLFIINLKYPTMLIISFLS